MDTSTRLAQNTARQRYAGHTSTALNAEYAARMANAILHELKQYLNPGTVLPPRVVTTEVYDYDIRTNRPNCIDVVSTNKDALDVIARSDALAGRNAQVMMRTTTKSWLVFQRQPSH